MPVSSATLNTPFQVWVVALLADREWSYRQAGDKLSMTATSIFDYVNGNSLPSAAVQARLADLSGASLDHVRHLVWTSEAQKQADRAMRAAARSTAVSSLRRRRKVA